MSREKILKTIAQNKPAELPMPAPFMAEQETGDLLEKFLGVLHSIGGQGKLVAGWHEIELALQQIISEEKKVVNCITNLPYYNAAEYVDKPASELEDVHTVFIEGKIAIAENAAIWVTESSMVNRLLPLICQQLVLVVKEQDLVANMHEAYSKVVVNEDGYGVFIAGPSKTADIEQSLVIGAHGPLALQVFILKS